MAKRKIIILGGGMAGLSAAYQLTKTPALRDRHDVTLYQLGWRLGGKAASGRDERGRNLEHGLHVWFGCYENTFQMIQEVYAARDPDVDWALKTWRDAVKPQDYTPIGTRDAAGRWKYWPLTWATNDGVPGDGRLLPSWFDVIETAINWIILYIKGADEPSAAQAISVAGPPPAHTAAVATPSGVLGGALAHIRRIGAMTTGPGKADLDRALDLVGWAHTAHAGTVGAAAAPGSDDAVVHAIFDVFVAVVKGVFWDLILSDAPLISLDHLEFRDWLLKHGANANIVAHSSVVRLVYDTLFQYENGDGATPNLAAGTGLGVIMRLVGTYKGSMMWEVQAGMGEVIVGPLYEHLVRNGVTFEFFHAAAGLEPDDGDPADPHPPIKTIRLTRQVRTLTGDYRPTVRENGLVLWPTQPHWDQLEGGAAMQAAGVNFESHWCDWPPAGPEVVLQRGEDFDTVVLAISLGAFKPLNDQDPQLCGTLIARGGAFADWVNNVGIVPSMAVQLWCNRPTADLGWTSGKPATVAGPEYLNIWADMTQVLAFETEAAPKPLSLHYLTGTYATTLYRAPASNIAAPAAASAEIRQQAINWLDDSSAGLWPAARAEGHFDWNVLSAPAGAVGEARFDAQFWRANIDPTECTTLSAAGTTKYRLHADGSGFSNLILAGEGTANGFTSSFEGAVMSGAAASRAICGEPTHVVGYDFLERKPSQGPGE